MSHHLVVIPAPRGPSLIDAACSSGGCGACCRHMNAPPFGFFDDEEKLPPELRAEVDGYADARPDGSPCFWYDAATNRCKHYEHRPVICRDFEPGSMSCFVHRLCNGVAGSLEAMATRTLAGMTDYRGQIPPMDL